MDEQKRKTMTVGEVATRLGCHKNTVYNYINKGKLRSAQPGGSRVTGSPHQIPVEDVEKLLEARSRDQKPEAPIEGAGAGQ